jgi:TorA maturation chaperone TorD
MGGVSMNYEVGLEARVMGYSFLFASLITEPSQELFTKISQSNLLDFLPYQNDQTAIQEGIKAIDNYINQEDYSDILEQLNIEYTKMFVVPDNSSNTHPFESVQRHAGRVFSLDETLEVRKHYMKHGLLPERLNEEPDDHVALELQFMKILAEKSFYAYENNEYKKLEELLDDQIKFMEKHLLQWAPKFAGNVVKATNADFYRGVGLILGSYLQQDYNYLQELRNWNKSRAFDA